MAKKGESNEMLFEDLDLFGQVEDLIKPVSSSAHVEQIEQTETTIKIPQEFNTVTETEDDSDDETEETDDDQLEESEDLKGAPSTNQNNDDNSSLLTPYAKFLVEEGILPNLNISEFDGTSDSLKQAMNQEIIEGVNYYKSTLPREVQYLIDNYEAGIPFEDILKSTSNQIKYNSIKSEDLGKDEDLQKTILKDFLKRTTKYTDDRIDKQINRLSDLAELEEEATLALKELMIIEAEDVKEKKLQVEQRQKEMAQQREADLLALEKSINDTKEIIPNVPVSQAMKDKIKRNLTVPVAYDQNNNPVNKIGYYRNQNPLQFEIVLNYIYESTKEFTDWSVFSKVGKRTAVQEFEKAVNTIDVSSQASSRGLGGKTNTPVGKKGLLDTINFTLNGK